MPVIDKYWYFTGDYELFGAKVLSDFSKNPLGMTFLVPEEDMREMAEIANLRLEAVKLIPIYSEYH